MPDKEDESDLIKRAQLGEKAAFEALLQAYYDVIYRIAYKWCGDRTNAEDITQNACIKLARAIGGFQFKSSFLTWLYPLVINTAKDWAKSQARHPSNGEAEVTGAATSETENAIYANQILAHVRSLPEKEREALYLVFGAGMSHRAAATVMACKEKTVSWYIHEARKKLQTFNEPERRHG